MVSYLRLWLALWYHIYGYGWRYGIISTVMVGVMVSYLRLWLALWYHIYGYGWRYGIMSTVLPILSTHTTIVGLGMGCSVAILWFLTPDLWFSRDKFDHI